MKMRLKRLTSFSGIILSFFFLAMSQSAEASELEQKGKVFVEGTGTTKPVDPENPETGVNPGEGPSTEGALRFDFASSLNFGSVVITETNRTYYAQAQLFEDDTEARGSYVQITDERSGAYGWTLQVKQTTQFRNSVIREKEEQELAGAVLSLDKGWANSFGNSPAPTVTRDTIAINQLGAAYEVARAEPNQGMGTWTIEFGASHTNKNNQPATLSPLTDKEGQAVLDESYQKQSYKNSAISLNIPDTVKIHPVQYQTEIIWILSELP